MSCNFSNCRKEAWKNKTSTGFKSVPHRYNLGVGTKLLTVEKSETPLSLCPSPAVNLQSILYTFILCFPRLPPGKRTHLSNDTTPIKIPLGENKWQIVFDRFISPVWKVSETDACPTNLGQKNAVVVCRYTHWPVFICQLWLVQFILHVFKLQNPLAVKFSAVSVSNVM